MFILLCVTIVLLITNVLTVVELENYKKENNERFTNNETKITDLTNRLTYLNDSLNEIYMSESEINRRFYERSNGGSWGISYIKENKTDFELDNEMNNFCTLKQRFEFLDKKINMIAEKQGVKFNYTIPLPAKSAELIVIDDNKDINNV